MPPKHIDIIPQGFDLKSALKGIPIVFKDCKISIQVNISPQGTSLSIKPNNLPETKPLQIESKEPQFITPRDAKEIHGLSEMFFHNLAKKIGEYDGIRWVLEEGKLAEYLRENPVHKERSLAVKKMINPQLLAERCYRLLKDEGKEPYPDTARVPSGNRSRYMSYSDIARRLGISYSLYYNRIRPLLYKMIKQKPEAVSLKKQEDEAWSRAKYSWGEVAKRDKRIEKEGVRKL